jgi:hypothetical protein
MKSFQKIFLISCFVCALAVLSLPLLSSAAGTDDALKKLETVGGAAYGTGARTDLPGIVGSIIKTVLTLLGVGAALLIIYSGYVWMTARGKEERVTKAKDTLEAAIIGLIIIMAAYAITYFVVNALTSATGPAPSGGTPPTTP